MYVFIIVYILVSPAVRRCCIFWAALSEVVVVPLIVVVAVLVVVVAVAVANEVTPPTFVYYPHLIVDVSTIHEVNLNLYLYL